MDILEKRKSSLEKQVQTLTSELATVKATADQSKREKELFAEQLSTVADENKALKALLAQKEIHAEGVAQELARVQEELRASADKVRALENSHTSLQSSHDSLLLKNEELKNEVTTWEKDYELLEESSNIEVSWTYLKTRRDTLVEVSQEDFNLESELAKVNEAIERAQQPPNFSSPETSLPVVENPLIEVPSNETSLVETALVEAPIDEVPVPEVPVSAVPETPVTDEITASVALPLSSFAPIAISQVEVSPADVASTMTEDQLLAVDDTSAVEPVNDPSSVLLP
ncbi:PREDICTED: titin-like [Nicotiana attenuata]|uniref:titin-like n=1 Tax=Nicotiana attenuata TaxID=49451 RepID=UPI000905324A|nr:PREDICTED: titin-like [Nicotiana attenuata]